jgi:Flp pilus assembly protein TadG
VTAELVIRTPLLVLLLLFVVALGRLAGARIDVEGAAAQAARAASIARSPAAAAGAAQEAAASALAGQGVSCGEFSVSVGTADFVPGGSVTVTVSCSARLADLVGLRLPSAETLSATAVQPVDLYRGLSG